jgi:hypothetical protein
LVLRSTKLLTCPEHPRLRPALISFNLSLHFCNIDHTAFSKFPNLQQGAQRISHKAYFPDVYEATHTLTVQHTVTLNTYNLLSLAMTSLHERTILIWRSNLIYSVVHFLLFIYLCIMGWESTVSIATLYGLDGPEIDSIWGQDFSVPAQTSPGAHPASYTKGTVSFPGVNWLGHGINRPPNPVSVLKKE